MSGRQKLFVLALAVAAAALGAACWQLRAIEVTDPMGTGYGDGA